MVENWNPATSYVFKAFVKLPGVRNKKDDEVYFSQFDTFMIVRDTNRRKHCHSIG